MTNQTAHKVSDRLNEMGVPACDFNSELGQILAIWVAEGGTLLVCDHADGHQTYAVRLAEKPSPESPRFEP